MHGLTNPKFNKWFLHHDNAPAQISLVVRKFMTSKNITVKGRRFGTTVVHAEQQEVIDTVTFEYFQGCVKSWQTCWKSSIHAKGDYFEGDGGNLELRYEIFFYG